MRILPLIATFALVTSTLAVRADDADDNHEELFRARELSIDLFGGVAVGQETLENFSANEVEEDDELGAGIGANFFITRWLGIGADAYTENTAASVVDNTSVSLILRLPLDEAHLAPYIFAGGGYQFDPDEEEFAQAGAGLEIRVTPNWGLFIDGRYRFYDGSDNDVGIARLGVRLAF
jgi:opacity protein-like surface antigen